MDRVRLLVLLSLAATCGPRVAPEGPGAGPPEDEEEAAAPPPQAGEAERARAQHAVEAALGPDMRIDTLEVDDGVLTVTIVAREGDGEPLAARLRSSPELRDVRLVGSVAQGKGPNKRAHLMIEAHLR